MHGEKADVIKKIGDVVQEFTKNKMFNHYIENDAFLKEKISEFKSSYVRTLNWR